MRRTCLHLWEDIAKVAEVMFCVILDCYRTCHRNAECHALLQTAWQLQQTSSMLLQRACQQAVHLLQLNIERSTYTRLACACRQKSSSAAGEP